MSERPRVLITGVAGFIGSNLADHLLRQGYVVAGVDNLAYGVREQIPAGVRFHQLDIRSPELFDAVEEGDVIVHLAAKNCIADCQADPVETSAINVTGSVNVFEAARRRRAQKVLYAESSAVYEGTTVFPTPESELCPESFYAASKAAELYFAEAYARHHGLRTTALRYFNVYGPRQDYRRSIPPVMSAFIMKLARGEQPIIYGTGEKRRDFIHVDDVNAFHELAIVDRRTDGRVFNLGTGHNVSVNELYAMVARLLGASREPIRRPDLAGEAFATLADIGQARALGWAPRIELEAGLRGMIAHLRAEGLI
jgi:nucleoside-diphosphate-sugar epimerase